MVIAHDKKATSPDFSPAEDAVFIRREARAIVPCTLLRNAVDDLRSAGFWWTLCRF